MKVEFLKLYQFRNYAQGEFVFHPNVNFIWGKNGQGKTNIIEAIYLLLNGKSFRFSTFENLIRHGDYLESATIQLGVSSQAGHDHLQMTLLKGRAPQVTMNSKKTTTGAIAANYGAVLFCPDSLSIIKQGPDERRQFVDRLVVALHRNGAQLIRENEKCQKSKSKLLKSYLNGELSEAELMLILESLEPSLLIAGTKLAMARIRVMKSLLKKANDYAKMNLKNTNVDISVDYVISSQSAIDWTENQVYDVLKGRIAELRGTELRVGQSLVGPQKHELLFNFNTRDARQTCSQGQQRAIIIAFKLAQVMQQKELKGRYPVLLLDDVFSEFDEVNRKSLLQFLCEVPAQKFITTTDIGDVDLKATASGDLKDFYIESK
jgi:DNA replication and repair protein RecF